MAPSDKEIKGQKAQDDANPFIAFRRFADESISSFMNAVFSTASLFGSPSTSAHCSVPDYEKWSQEARESSQRLAREAEEAGRIMDVYTRAHREGQHAIQGALQEPASDNDSKPLRCPYRPAEQETPRPEKPYLNICLMDHAARSALSLRLPSTVLATPVLGKQLPSVSIAYLLYSPYSPIRLEQQPHLCEHGAKWREAFEDLLAVQNGQELPPKCSQRMPESSIDWVREMIEFALCKREEDAEASSSAASKTSEAMKQDPGLTSRFTGARQPENDAHDHEEADGDNLDDDGDAETTELEMYDRFFTSQQPSFDGSAKAAARSFARLQQDSSPSDTDSKIPSILSTLTTTERTTLQDGSVHTKVVLKKRFSDGREESTETVHHQNAVRQTHDAALNSIKDENARTTGEGKGTTENKSSGWFWS
ncbi:MAG: hypothetical protein ALECFALPRED_001106 [Alectoria fallacina]|uniref:Uncharacterized protein n=1 Tax=Alectoria fallacina TaxID=1903189 RepID=A0A8H3JAM2_9LECA|nr:MAG: hypothetical protein ALECFALPRED_001106 [Alectoria fallacina]